MFYLTFKAVINLLNIRKHFSVCNLWNYMFFSEVNNIIIVICFRGSVIVSYCISCPCDWFCTCCLFTCLCMSLICTIVLSLWIRTKIRINLHVWFSIAQRHGYSCWLRFNGASLQSIWKATTLGEDRVRESESLLLFGDTHRLARRW